MASYIVYKGDDGTIYVKNGKTGQIELTTTDGTQAIQYAIDNSRFGDTIFIMAGRYYLSKPLTPKSGITIIGSEPFTLGFNDNITIWVDSIGPNLGGTVLIGNDTFPAFQYTDDLIGFRVKNIGLQHFTYGFKLGSPDKLVGMISLENVYMSYILNWGIEVYNLSRSIFRKVYMDGRETYTTTGGFIHIIGAHNKYVSGNCRFEEVFYNGNNQTIGILIETDPNYTYGWNILTIDTYQMNSPPPKENPNASPISYALYVKGADSNHKVAQISVYSLLPEGQYDYAVRLENVEHVNIVFYRTGTVWFNTGTRYSVVFSPSITKVRNDSATDNIVITGYYTKSALSGTKNTLIYGYNVDFGAAGLALYDATYGKLYIMTCQGPTGDGKDIVVNRAYLDAYISYKYAGNVTVTAGSTSVTVNLPAWTPTPYAVVVTPTWNTKWWVSNVTNTSFTINFDTPPSSDSDVYYVVIVKR